MSQSDVVELFHLCASSRDEEAWQEFVDRFDGHIRYKIVCTLHRLDQAAERDEVEDLVQEVYCRILERGVRRRVRFRARTEAEVLAYLQRVCDSAVVDRLRARATLKRGGRARFVHLSSSTAAGDSVETLADSQATPETELLGRELRSLLLTSCRRLSRGAFRERNLAIFRLAVLEGWSSREIADSFDWGLKAASVDSVVHRQRKKLRRYGLEVPAR